MLSCGLLGLRQSKPTYTLYTFSFYPASTTYKSWLYIDTITHALVQPNWIQFRREKSRSPTTTITLTFRFYRPNQTKPKLQTCPSPPVLFSTGSSRGNRRVVCHRSGTAFPSCARLSAIFAYVASELRVSFLATEVS